MTVFSIFGQNAAGLLSKKESLFFAINSLQPSAITIQESKMKKIGLLKIPGYQIFEKIRKIMLVEAFLQLLLTV